MSETTWRWRCVTCGRTSRAAKKPKEHDRRTPEGWVKCGPFEENTDGQWSR